MFGTRTGVRPQRDSWAAVGLWYSPIGNMPDYSLKAAT